MNWPTSQDYNEAIQNAASSFADPGLKSGAVTLNSLGLPVPRSGNFADVYQFKGGDGKMWAVKCFTRKVDGLQQRYLKIDEHLTKAKLPFTVGFKFFEQGIRVRGQWFPLLKMEWVEGFTLNEFVRDNASKPQYLHALVQMWGKLTARLRDADFAHADLQHCNVLLVPGGAPNKLGLKLIDYDGMWVPALADTHSGEIGHPNFQHPLRLKNRLYNADVDRFPHLVVACALRAVMTGGRALWDKFDNSDNLLFKEPDLRDPARAQVFSELWNLRDDVLCTLVGIIALASREPLRKTPWLDDLLLMEGGPRLTADDEKKVIEMLGVAPHFTASKAAGAAHAPMQEEFGHFNFDEDLTDEKPAARPQSVRTSRKPAGEKKTKEENKKSRLPLYIGGGVLAACLIGGIIALTTGGSGKKNNTPPQEIAKNGNDDDKTKVLKGRNEEKPKQSITPDKTDLAKGNNSEAPDVVNKESGVEKNRPLLDKSDSAVAHVDNDFLKPDNWEGMDGNWTIESSTIIGKTETALRNSTFFRTKRKYKDFELSFQARLTNSVGGSGVQFRSAIIDDPSQFMVAGPQADIGNRIWGDLFGYRFIPNGKFVGNGFGYAMKKADQAPLNIKPADFNDYALKVVGKKVTITVNAVVTVDQEFPNLPDEGIIALELDKGAAMEVTFKNIVFKQLNVSNDPNGIVVAKKGPPTDEIKDPTAVVDNEFLKSDNWEGMDGLWTIDRSTIVGKAAMAPVRSTFYCTKKKYKDFELTFQVRFANGFGGSGVQFRSMVDDPAKFMVSGPQADMGYEQWGDLYAYRMAPEGLMKKADLNTLNVKPADFNDYSIRVVGKKVTIKINGVVAVDDEFPKVPDEGIIALELDRIPRRRLEVDGTMEVTFKNIVLKRLDDIGIAKKGPVGERPELGPLEFKAKSPVTCVASIPESSAMLFACQGDATLYGITERGETAELGKHDRPIRAICCSPDGSRAITAGEDGLLRVWSLDETVRPDPLTGNASRIKFDKFAYPCDVLLCKDAAAVLDEANDKKDVIHLGKPGHRAIVGFKKNLDLKPELAQRLGAALTDEVHVFDHALVVQIFEGGVLVCDVKSGKIAWGTRAPVHPSVRAPALSQFKAARDLKQHTGAVLACAISPDGERAVSIGADAQLCEWNIKEGKLIRKFAIPASSALAYLTDGKSVLLGTNAESAIVVDLEKQKRVMTLAGHKGKVLAVCLTKNGKHGYTAGDDCTVRIWDMASGALVKTLAKHTAPVVSLAAMPNAQFALSADAKGQICLWDSNRIVGRLGGEYVSNWDVQTAGFNELSDSLVIGTAAEGVAGAVRRVHLNIDNEPAVVTISDAGNIPPLIKKPDPPLVKKPDPPSANDPIATSKELSARLVDCLYSSDCKRIYAVTQQGDLHVLDPLTLEETQKQQIVDGAIVHAVVSSQTIPAPMKPAKDWLCVLDANKRLHVFDPDKGASVKNVSLEVQLTDRNMPPQYVLSAAPDGRVLFVLTRTGARGAMWDIKTNTDALVPTLLRAPFKSTTRSVAFSADGRFGAAATPAKLLVWNVKTGQDIRLFDVRSANQLAIVPEANVVAALGAEISAFDFFSGKELWSEKPESVVHTLQAIPKSKRLVVALGATNLSITIRDCVSGKETHRWESPGRGSQAVSVAGDGKTLVSYGGLDNKVRLWNIPAADKKP